MAGGPKAAIQLLPALGCPSIRFARVFEPSDAPPDITVLKQASQDLPNAATFFQ